MKIKFIRRSSFWPTSHDENCGRVSSLWWWWWNECGSKQKMQIIILKTTVFIIIIVWATSFVFIHSSSRFAFRRNSKIILSLMELKFYGIKVPEWRNSTSVWCKQYWRCLHKAARWRCLPREVGKTRHL